jgi:pyruvate dehydrogenase E1 component alpha subunit
VRFAEGYGLAAERVDGMDVEAVADAAARAVERARSGAGATFLECETYRKYGHNIGDTGAARPSEEIERWGAREPIGLVGERLVSRHAVAPEQLERIASEQAERLARAVEWAEALPEPPVEWALEDVYAEPEVVAAMGLAR